MMKEEMGIGRCFSGCFVFSSFSMKMVLPVLNICSWLEAYSQRL